MSAPDAPDVRLLQLSVMTSSFDRFVVGPLLLSLAADFDVRLDTAALVAGVYFLAYGLSQPAWGRCSDALGRVRTMRLALGSAAVLGTASALATDLTVLMVLRGCAGAAMAAAVPGALVYVGDAVPFLRRQSVLTDLNAATAIGITAATALGGVLAATLSWRVAFALPAVAAGALAVGLRRLPEPPRAPGRAGGLLVVLRSRWGPALLALALAEGAVLLGLLTYLAPALESRGVSPALAGAVVGLYGAGLLLGSRIVKRRAGSTSAPVFLALGAGGLALSYLLAALSQSTASIGVAASLLGVAWASLHSTMQAWATEAVPGARAATVSLFAGALFVGSGVATAVLAPWAGDLRWGSLYGSGAGLAVLFGVAVTVTRARFGRTATPPPAVP